LKKILFYLSGHGFGHATRMIEVMKQLYTSKRDIRCIIKTTAPKWLFELNLDKSFEYSCLKSDIGVVQKDSLNLDKLSTLKEYAKLLQSKQKLVTEEAYFVKENRVSAIVGDIPPFAFDIAKDSGIPGIAISNFSWGWIYKDYVSEFPEYGFLVEEIESSYSKADLLLRLPFFGDMSAFPKREDIPLLVRRSGLSYEEILKKFDLKKNLLKGKKTVLLSFGGFYHADIDFGNLLKLNDYLFFSFTPVPERTDNLLVLPPQFADHHHLVRISDIVVSKPGYGIVAECIANKKPLLYTSRGDFAEYPVLSEGMKRYIPALFIPREDFHAGKWGPYLEEILRIKEKKESMPLDGGNKAAERILSFLS
jgi:UDP:flavonoid glycosyltransferase YjiC (YdhE family)